MALTYNIETDVRYQQGIEKGREKGIEEGIEKGKEAEKEEMILAMLQSGLLADEQIAQLADTDLKRVQRMKKQSGKK